MKTYAALLAFALGALLVGPVGAAPDPETAALLTRLAVQRRDAARRTYEVLWIDYREGRAAYDVLYRWSVRLLEAERHLAEQPADVIAAYRGHYDRMRELEKLIRRTRASGNTTIDQLSAAEFYRTEAELWWVQAKEGRPKEDRKGHE